MNQKETEAMKPTQQRTEEGELPILEVWQDDYGRLSVEMKSPCFRDFGPGRHEYVPSAWLADSREANEINRKCLAKIVELEKERTWLRNDNNAAHEKAAAAEARAERWKRACEEVDVVGNVYERELAKDGPLKEPGAR